MKEEKQLLLDEITEKSSSIYTLVLNYKNLTNNTIWDLRSQLGAVPGVDFEFVRRRLLIRSLDKFVSDENITGSTAILSADSLDNISGVTKILNEWNDEEKNITVLFGIIDGKKYGSEYIAKISKLPPMDVMRAELVGLLETPMSSLLAVFDSLLSSTIHCLDNKCRQEGEQNE